MNTKFILHGGFAPGNTNEDNSAFYAEILKDAPEDAKILLVLFAKDADRWVIAEERLKGEFNKAKWQESISFEVASEEGFLDQVKNADVVYLSGGSSKRALDVLAKFPEFPNLLEGKTVAGESGGANVLTKFFYSPSADEVFEGLGILPYKMIPHFTEEKRSKLDGTGEGLEEMFLHEYEFQVIGNVS